MECDLDIEKNEMKWIQIMPHFESAHGKKDDRTIGSGWSKQSLRTEGVTFL